MWRVGVTSLLVMTVWVASTLAQHGYSTAEIVEGGRLFQASCARCHGPDGDGVAGLNFSRGQFRRVASDDEIARIIMVGIPGTGMPPGNFSEFDAGRIVAYLRSMAAAPAENAGSPGNAARGKALVEGKGQCLTCHRVDGAGSQLGPDLNSVGPLRRTVDLRRSLLDPDAEIFDDNRFARVVTRDGEAITGRLLNQDSFSIQLFDMKERLLSFTKSDLRDWAMLKSPMPSYRDKLSSEELADVVSYLRSLKGRP